MTLEARVEQWMRRAGAIHDTSDVQAEILEAVRAVVPSCPAHGPMRIIHQLARCEVCGMLDELSEAPTLPPFEHWFKARVAEDGNPAGVAKLHDILAEAFEAGRR